MASLHFRKLLLYFLGQTLSESHMQLHESLTIFQCLKHPGKLNCFRMEHRYCNSVLLKWDLEQFEPILSFFCAWTRFMLIQGLMADVLNVKFKALELRDLKTLLASGKIWEVIVTNQIVTWFGFFFCCHFTESKL